MVELLVVIAILAILSAILFPVFAQAKQAAKRTTCLSNVRQWSLGLTQYTLDADGAFPNNGDPYLWVGKRMRWTLMPYLGVGQREGAGFSSASGSPQILVCPSDPGAGSYDQTSYAMSATLYHSPNQIAQLRLRNLIPGLQNPLLGNDTQTESQAFDPSRKIGFAEWLNGHRNPGKPAGFWGTLKPGLAPGDDRFNGGRNSAFLDGHAGFVEASRQTRSADDCPDMNLTPGGIAGTDR